MNPKGGRDELLANQHTIIANQERIQSNQSKLDLLLANQEAILANQAKLDLRISQGEHAEATPEMIGVNPVFKEIVRKARSVAGADATVLVCGETGTGKELLARDIHALSARRHRPLVTVNCATLPAGLIESDLFGHERGAFTGAFQRKLGRFEVADGSTIFSTRGEVPVATRPRSYAFCSTRIRALGGLRLKFMCAYRRTNQSLENYHRTKVSLDLFYRLKSFRLRCLLCASARKTSCCSSTTSPENTRGVSAKVFPQSIKPRSNAFRNTDGRETSANSNTSSSARC